ncbi:DUF6036 family nucleotidyltransferase [Pseudosulfitobacter pseudonitzschiae]|uniref:DUF6036 family nucleotidyltransferase n=1 Tax=Pseudosulfitobacter pseudonitzschiae TaxID=1402135 RepID=UPI003B781D2E
MAHRKLLPELRYHIQRISERTGRLREPVHAYLAGGMAVNFHTGSRMSRNVEIKWSHRLAVPPDLQVFEVLNPIDPDDIQIVSMDGEIGDHLGSFHPDWKQDSEEVAHFGDLVLHVISAIDLAVSKIGRFSERDREDITDLASHGLISSKQLEIRGAEAIDHYIGDNRFMQLTLGDAIEIVKKFEHDDCQP